MIDDRKTQSCHPAFIAGFPANQMEMPQLVRHDRNPQSSCYLSSPLSRAFSASLSFESGFDGTRQLTATLNFNFAVGDVAAHATG